MTKGPDFEVPAAHRFFSAHCFNRAWDFIDKAQRSAADTDEMLQAAHASAWHWRQRPDCTNDKLAIGYWQLSRVYALAGDVVWAKHYGGLCLQVSRELTPFLLGYAHEALARAAALARESDALGDHLARAKLALGQVTDPQERQLLEKDLGSIAPNTY
jgi:cation transport regulator ChaB